MDPHAPRRPRAAGAANGLLARLPPLDRQRFLAACEPTLLVAGQVLAEADGRWPHAYFPDDAIVSLGLPVPASRSCLEVAQVGPEGMVGLPLLLGADGSALRPTVVSGGACSRITAAGLLAQLAASTAVQDRMNLYVAVGLDQLAQAALCTQYHHVDQRLARWLLMTRDRVHHGELRATHEFLAATLGVRRAGITRAARELQQQQLIAYHRGMLTVLDRAGLEAIACGCYAADRARYQALLGPAARA
jgi:CRP-like cAMP-binding protein